MLGVQVSFKFAIIAKILIFLRFNDEQRPTNQRAVRPLVEMKNIEKISRLKKFL